MDTVIARHEGGVLHLTLNRPEVRNAMSVAMVLELRQALDRAEKAGDVRVIVLRGADGHFCAGGDIKDMAIARQRMQVSSQDAIAEVSAAFGELCVAYSHTGIATVAVVEGTVMGGGFGLACVADVVIAGVTAQFRLPETSLGLVPAQIAPFLVERLGVAEAKRLAVTGGRLDAQEALQLRLVHQVHPVDMLDHATAEVVRHILHGAPGALATTKALIAQARFHTPASLVHEAAAAFSRAAQGPEGMAGMSAFLAKRKPGWAPE
jgi:isohexenylglutaconyl-CoA hydratase